MRKIHLFLVSALMLSFLPLSARAAGELQIGPVPGLTTVWHPAPAQASIPLGSGSAVLHFKVPASPATFLAWSGATEISREGGWSTAEARLEQSGQHVVRVQKFAGGRFYSEEVCVLEALAITPDQIDLRLEASVPPSVLEDDPASASVDDYFAHLSIASLRPLADGFYRTSTLREVTLTAEVEPAGFEPLIEWRSSDRPPLLGARYLTQHYRPHLEQISAGPPAAPGVTYLQTYRVEISHDSTGPRLFLDSVPTTFTATTEPPGYEDEVRWFANTKFGSAHPATGRGPQFTVTFQDFFGPEGRSWLGIRADDARLSKDGKEGCLSDQLCNFRGLEHRALGSVALAIEEDVLVARDFGTGGGDGFAIDLGGASRSWRGHLELGFMVSGDGSPIPGATVTQTAVDLDGKDTAALMTTLLEDGQLGFSAQFRSSTYRLEILSAGEVVHTEPFLPSDLLAPSVVGNPCGFWEVAPNIFVYHCEPVIVFRINAADECEWDQRFPEAVDIQIAGLSFMGDRLRFIENLDPDVGYTSYALQRITATDAESVAVIDEFVEPSAALPNLVAEPAYPMGTPPFPFLFCDSPSPVRYAVIVRNQGGGSAGPSLTELDRFEAGQKMALETPPLPPGEEVTLFFEFGGGAGVNQPFRVTVDVEDVVTEGNESDNAVEDECRIEP